jgi:hypothetical protein
MDTRVVLILAAAALVAAVCLVISKFVRLNIKLKSEPSRFDLAVASPTPPTPALSVSKTKSVNLAIKCACGLVHRFHKVNGKAAAGSQPFPQGDVYICPGCGKSLDLKSLRELAGKAGADL